MRNIPRVVGGAGFHECEVHDALLGIDHFGDDGRGGLFVTGYQKVDDAPDGN